VTNIRQVGLTTGFIGPHTITVYTLYNSLQFTITLDESSHCIFTRCLSSNIAGSVRLQLFSEDCCSARTLTGNWNCPRQLIILVIAVERTTKKTLLRFPYCWMTSLPEWTTKKTLVASIVALLSNRYKQRFCC
jgi:hypothetical protein